MLLLDFRSLESKVPAGMDARVQNSGLYMYGSAWLNVGIEVLAFMVSSKSFHDY